MLVTQLDAFAVEPWGFLGLSGQQFREAIGYTEAVGAIATLLPWQPVRKAGPARYCPPSRQTHREPSCLEVNGIL
jgi:hypothetical protein